jgi:hypothetical protein
MARLTPFPNRNRVFSLQPPTGGPRLSSLPGDLDEHAAPWEASADFDPIPVRSVAPRPRNLTYLNPSDRTRFPPRKSSPPGRPITEPPRRHWISISPPVTVSLDLPPLHPLISLALAHLANMISPLFEHQNNGSIRY